MSAFWRGFLPTVLAVVGIIISDVGMMSAGSAAAGDRLTGSRWAIVEE